eukprot:4427659-Amphidinium_carterae.1
MSNIFIFQSHKKWVEWQCCFLPVRNFGTRLMYAPRGACTFRNVVLVLKTGTPASKPTYHPHSAGQENNIKRLLVVSFSLMQITYATMGACSLIPRCARSGHAQIFIHTRTFSGAHLNFNQKGVMYHRCQIPPNAESNVFKTSGVLMCELSE